VAAALFIAVFFLVLHTIYLPYKSGTCNKLQFLSLSVICVIYYVGLLLKTDSMDSTTSDDLGGFLVFLLVFVLLLVLYEVGLEIWALRHWMHSVRYETDIELKLDPSLSGHIIDQKELQLGKILGQGAEGVVQQASYGGTQVAVKVHDCSPHGPVPLADQIKDAQLEAQRLLPLRHPHIVMFYGVSIMRTDVEVKILTVLELCKTAVHDWILSREQQITMRERVECCMQIAKGMGFLHSRGVMHRDLKPQNVLLCFQDGRNVAKIADFGLSRTITGHKDVIEQGEKTANVGTPLYMAPELMSSAKHTTYDASVDIYSFGVLMWAVLSRDQPYSKEVKRDRLNLWSLRDLVVRGGRPYIEGNNELHIASTMGASNAIRIMEQCWDPDPERRPSSFLKVDERLGMVLADMDKEESREKATTSSAVVSVAGSIRSQMLL
jgi:serine/threonine protein kinase